MRSIRRLQRIANGDGNPRQVMAARRVLIKRRARARAGAEWDLLVLQDGLHLFPGQGSHAQIAAQYRVFLKRACTKALAEARAAGGIL